MTSKLPSGTLALFSSSLFLSAALMFSLQPMIGKMLLPIAGGSPSGWIVAMAFFQVMLLAGYFLAHALSRFEPRVHALLYLVCLGAGYVFLPVALTAPDHSPAAGDIFILLTKALAVPFVAISATASTLQRLFTTTKHTSAKDPYFLYAASNLGSFFGLLLYPFVIEPNMKLTAQSYDWRFGYILMAIMTVACLLISRKKNPPQKTEMKTSARRPSWKRRMEWLILSLIPSGLLLAVTTHITTDILSVPLLWVLPLGIYLLTFVIAFSKKPLVGYEGIAEVQPVAAAIALALILFTTGASSMSLFILILHLGAFAVTALMCHMRLAQTRPVDDSRYLTEFYLFLALGGALGGILNAFIMPVVSSRLIEYPLMLLASVFLNKNIRATLSKGHVYTFLAGCGLILIFSFLESKDVLTVSGRMIFLLMIPILLATHPKTFLIMGVLSFLGISAFQWAHPSILSTRNFYGVIKVYDKVNTLDSAEKINVRYMQHGTTLHGTQMLDKKYETVPTTYYTRGGPLNDIIAFLQPKTIAAIGLGTGSINCYATPARKITFIEIDPDVVKMAKEKFTYLSKCGAGIPDIITGDARLEMQKLDGKKFDLIILDAFSSDSIPTHLLTKEAVEIYLDHLTPKGVILFHISNRFFRLEGPIAASGALLGLKNTYVMRKPAGEQYAAASKWIVLTRPGIKLTPLLYSGWRPVKSNKKPWTDDYTNLLNALNF